MKSSLVIVVEVEHEEGDGDLRGFTNETTAIIAAAVFKKPHTVISSNWQLGWDSRGVEQPGPKSSQCKCGDDPDQEEISCPEHGDPSALDPKNLYYDEPDSCNMCGSTWNMSLVYTTYFGKPVKAWVCPCGHAHLSELLG